MGRFYGRKRELQILKELRQRSAASLIVIRGRRRIGKSRLAEKFREQFSKHYTFLGLPPEEKVTDVSQREHFAHELEEQTGLRGVRTDDWDFLLYNLASFCQEGPTLVVLDEINWMGTQDATFLGKLKTAWDTKFKKNPRLIMILSGSMSGWIDKNILSSTGFFGRIDLDIDLKELSLQECNHFWDPVPGAATYEKFKLLSVTGGVPRYLELIQPKLSAEENIQRLFLRKEGALFYEYERIFSDLFSNRSEVYKKIVALLGNGPATQEEIRGRLKLAKSGSYSKYLDDLVRSSFVSRDYTWSIKRGVMSKLSVYRLSDNYLRFYLKYVQPRKEKILAEGEVELGNWYPIMGLQFENLVLNHRSLLYPILGLQKQEILISNPYFQRKASHQKGVQIDYLIQTIHNILYFVEVKFSKHPVGRQVIDEMQQKVERIALPRGFSYRTCLIHVNGVTDEVEEEGYFSHIIDFGQLLEEG